MKINLEIALIGLLLFYTKTVGMYYFMKQTIQR